MSYDCLPELTGAERIPVKCDEKWSPRKVLRRVLWHEREHTKQVGDLLEEERFFPGGKANGGR